MEQLLFLLQEMCGDISCASYSRCNPESFLINSISYNVCAWFWLWSCYLNLFITFHLWCALLACRQSSDCPFACEVTLKFIDKVNPYQTTKHKKIQTIYTYIQIYSRGFTSWLNESYGNASGDWLRLNTLNQHWLNGLAINDSWINHFLIFNFQLVGFKWISQVEYPGIRFTHCVKQIPGYSTCVRQTYLCRWNLWLKCSSP